MPLALWRVFFSPPPLLVLRAPLMLHAVPTQREKEKEVQDENERHQSNLTAATAKTTTHNKQKTGSPFMPRLTVSSKLAVAAAGDDGGYFTSFRNSFHPRASSSTDAPATASVSHYMELLGDLVVWERELRQQLLRHEAAELTQIAHLVERVLLPLIPALCDVSPLDLVQQEQVGRWSIIDDYYQLLLDAVELQEMLHRRATCSVVEPQQRKQIEDGEVPHWIEARRLQVMRQSRESASANEEQVRRLAHFEHVQQQLYQVFLLEESEHAARMEVERLQRLHVGGLAEVIAKEYRRVRLCQLRYEAARHPLRPSLSYEIAAEEGLHRSMLSQEQAHAFKSIQAAEVRDYLTRVR